MKNSNTLTSAMSVNDNSAIETIESLLKRLNKTTIYVIVDALGATLLYPKVIGNTVMYNMLRGYCEHDGDMRLNKVECGDGRRVDSQYAMSMVDHAVSRNHDVNEIVVEGYSELEPCGELEWNLDDEKWRLTWK